MKISWNFYEIYFVQKEFFPVLHFDCFVIEKSTKNKNQKQKIVANAEFKTKFVVVIRIGIVVVVQLN